MIKNFQAIIINTVKWLQPTFMSQWTQPKFKFLNSINGNGPWKHVSTTSDWAVCYRSSLSDQVFTDVFVILVSCTYFVILHPVAGSAVLASVPSVCCTCCRSSVFSSSVFYYLFFGLSYQRSQVLSTTNLLLWLFT